MVPPCCGRVVVALRPVPLPPGTVATAHFTSLARLRSNEAPSGFATPLVTAPRVSRELLSTPPLPSLVIAIVDPAAHLRLAVGPGARTIRALRGDPSSRAGSVQTSTAFHGFYVEMRRLGDRLPRVPGSARSLVRRGCCQSSLPHDAWLEAQTGFSAAAGRRESVQPVVFWRLLVFVLTPRNYPRARPQRWGRSSAARRAGSPGWAARTVALPHGRLVPEGVCVGGRPPAPDTEGARSSPAGDRLFASLPRFCPATASAPP